MGALFSIGGGTRLLLVASILGSPKRDHGRRVVQSIGSWGVEVDRGRRAPRNKRRWRRMTGRCNRDKAAVAADLSRVSNDSHSPYHYSQVREPIGRRGAVLFEVKLGFPTTNGCLSALAGYAWLPACLPACLPSCSVGRVSAVAPVASVGSGGARACITYALVCTLISRSKSVDLGGR